MKIKKEKTGISLIVLVITILVLSILAATVIISLSNTNVVGQATNAKKASEIFVMKEAANVIYVDLLLHKGDDVTAKDIVDRLKEQGYTDEQLDLIAIIERDGNIYIRSKGVYGVRREVGSTSTSWERIEDSVGLVANACKGTVTDIQNDFDSIYPWSDIVSYNWDTVNETVTAVYGDSNYKTDGTNGDVLTKIPEFYYKREQKVENGKTYEYIYISGEERAGYTKSEEFSIGRYLSSFNSEGTELRSVSGANVATNKNITEFRTLAKNTNYTLLDYRYFALQLLYLVEYADYHSQTKLGKGQVSYRYVATDKAIVSVENSNTITIALTDMSKYKVGQQVDIGTGDLGSRGSSTQTYRTITKIEAYSGGGQTITFDGDPINIVSGSHGIWSCAQNTGSADSLGMKSGYVGTNGYSSVVYRGVEDFFGNVFQLVDGINIKSTGEVYVSYNSEAYESNKFDGDYQSIGYSVPTSGGYVRTFGYSKSNSLIMLPTSTETTYDESIKDHYYFYTHGYSGVGRVGGFYSYDSAAGLFCCHVYRHSTASSTNLTSRVLK